jgi:hypothetical protein
MFLSLDPIFWDQFLYFLRVDFYDDFAVQKKKKSTRCYLFFEIKQYTNGTAYKIQY